MYLFVYGTLMRNNQQGQYLKDAEYLGEFILPGYSLYDFGYYPGIVEDKDGMVKGELYLITEDMLPQLDLYEEEGTLYRRIFVHVYKDEDKIQAYTYVYNLPVEEAQKVPFSFLPWYEGIVESMKE